MKLLIINDAGITGGGTENRVRMLVDELLKQKIFEEIHLLTKFSQQPHPVIFVHQCKYNESPFLHTLKIIRKHKINIVQMHNSSVLWPTPILAAKLLRKPVLFFAHDYWPICGRRSFIKAETASKEMLCEKTQIKKCAKCIGIKSTLKLKLWKSIINLANVGISASHFLKNIYENEKVLRNKWQIVLPWIDINKFKTVKNNTLPKKENIILFVSSLIEFKGAWVAAKALKYIIQKVPDAKLAFIGDLQEPESRYRQDIENICKQDKTIGNVTFLGRQNWDSIKEWHLKSKVFIFPTVCMESFGLVWAEAMVSGVPIVASAVGSIPELISDKGILVPPLDEIALANAIINGLTNPKLANDLSSAGKTYALKTFNIKTAADSLIKIYKTIAIFEKNV